MYEILVFSKNYGKILVNQIRVINMLQKKKYKIQGINYRTEQTLQQLQEFEDPTRAVSILRTVFNHSKEPLGIM